MEIVTADGEIVDAEERLEAIARDIEAVQASAVLRVGERLHAARELFRYKRDEGGFTGWVERRLSFSERTAYRLVEVYEKLGSESLPIWQTLPRSVLYELAAPSTPDAVREEVQERVEAGETVTAAEVKRLKKKLEEETKKAEAAKLKALQIEGRLVGLEEQRDTLDRRVRELMDQAELAKRGQQQSAKPVTLARDPKDDFEVVQAQVDALMRAWNAAGPEAREQFRERIDSPLFDNTRSGRAA